MLESSPCDGCSGRCGIRLGGVLRLDGPRQRIRIDADDSLRPGDRVALSVDEVRVEGLLSGLFFLPVVIAVIGFVATGEVAGPVGGLIIGGLIAVIFARLRTRADQSFVLISREPNTAS